jgi:trans-aconitate 2-methyltransferase
MLAPRAGCFAAAAAAASVRFGAEARRLNALHWVPDQAAVLRGILDAMRPTGRALLQLVSKGSRKPLEDVIEETCAEPRWSRYFVDHHRPYLHLSPEEYRRLAERCGLRVDHVDVALEAWDFGSRAVISTR